MVLVTAPIGLTAQDRLVRKFGGESDLMPPIVALAQDSVGFIWVGTRAGLFRYDGARFQRWAPEILPRAVGSIAVSRSGRTIVVDADGRILELTADGAHELQGTARRSPDHTQVAAFDAQGRLWVIGRDGDVAWHEPSGVRHPVPAASLSSEAVRKVFPGGPDGGVIAAGSEGLWRMSAGSSPSRLLDDHLVLDVLALDDGSVLALTHEDVFRIHRGSGAEVLPWGAPIPPTRMISLAERGGTFWVGTDRYLIALAPGGEV
jgi:ligand-binding sensor domain-containing protein